MANETFGTAAVRRGGPGRAEGCAGRVVHGAITRDRRRGRGLRRGLPDRHADQPVAQGAHLVAGVRRDAEACCASWPPGRRSACWGEQPTGPAGTSSTVQYWRSAEHLGRFARDPEMLHQPAWAAFNRAGAGTGDVGIWHETFLVPAANIESLYGNMPEHGLGAALGSEPRGNTGGPAPRTRWASRTRSTSRPDAAPGSARVRDRHVGCRHGSRRLPRGRRRHRRRVVVAKKRSELAPSRRRPPSSSR